MYKRQGFDFKEVQISEEKRLDVVITYLKEKYLVELKIWRGEEYHKKGLDVYKRQIFGSLTKDDFNEESDIDIAIIGENKISDTVDLNLTLELEDFLGRSIDLIDINDEEI